MRIHMATQALLMVSIVMHTVTAMHMDMDIHTGMALQRKMLRHVQDMVTILTCKVGENGPDWPKSLVCH